MGSEKTNRYIVEIAVPTVETYEVVSEIPLTKREIVKRTQHRKPQELKYNEAIPTVLVIEGSIEDEEN
jgi:hypothetical protein